jgi:hypothetical protein
MSIVLFDNPGCVLSIPSNMTSTFTDFLINFTEVALGDVMVILLAIGPKIRELKPDRER